MKHKIALGMSVMAALAGCGKNHSSSSSNPSGFATIQGVCSQNSIELHRALMDQTTRAITNRTRLAEINSSCESLHSELGDNACEIPNRGHKLISFSDVSNYCSEVQTYLNQQNPTHPPRPVPVTPGPTPIPGRVDNVLLEDVSTRYAFYFEKSTLDFDDMDVRSGQTRCQISMSDYANVNLRSKRGDIVSIRISNINGDTTYSAIMTLVGSNEMARIKCRSHDARMTVRDFNTVLDGIVELRMRR